MIRSIFAPIAMKVSAGIILALLLAVGAQEIRVRGERAARLEAAQALKDEKAASALFAERVKAKAEEITRKAAQLARDIEARQNQVSQEVSGDYQSRLAALRRQYDALRLRAESDRANPGGAQSDPVPGLPSPSGGPDAAAADYAFRCEADAIQLEALQRWVREQQGVER